MLVRATVMPAFRGYVRNQIGYSSVALPPVFVSIAQSIHDRGQELGIRRIGHIVDLLGFDIIGRRVSMASQKIPMASRRMGQDVPTANPYHLGAGGIQGA